MASSRDGGAEERTRHHVASVADVFLSPGPAQRVPATRPTILLAAPGESASRMVVPLRNALPAKVPTHLLGDHVGERLPCWETAGRVDGVTTGGILMWCVRGTEASSLSCGLLLGRLVAMLAPRATTVLWLPESDGGRTSAPAASARDVANRLVGAAVNAAGVVVHCVGWSQSLGADLGSLARRFA
jgi:hypothetical protein